MAQWTQYSLDEFAPPSAERNVLPEGSKKTPTVHTAYIALGSNLGDRIGWIESACKLMSSRNDIRITRTSCLWETEPMYVTDQGSFVNGVCEVTRTFQSSGQLGVMDPSISPIPKPQSHD
jgi:2-amino-4-hydroxy-6-hydroxymethyldihydropteridine diphosphokinase/dihydropteroate synthase